MATITTNHLESVVDRLMGVMQEVTDIACDIDLSLLSDHPRERQVLLEKFVYHASNVEDAADFLQQVSDNIAEKEQK